MDAIMTAAEAQAEIRRLSGAVKQATDSAEASARAVGDLTKLLEQERAARTAERFAAAEREIGSEADFAREYVYKADDAAIQNVPRGDLLRVGNDRVLLVRSASSPDGGTRPGLVDSAPVSDSHRAFLDALTRRNLAKMILTRGQRRGHTPQLDREAHRAFLRTPLAAQVAAAGVDVARIFSDSSGIGAELVFDEDVPMLERAIDLQSAVGNLFRSVGANAPTINFPFLNSGFQPYLTGAAPTVDDPAKFQASSAAFADRSYTVKEMAIRAVASRTAVEDSVIAFMPMIMDEFARATRRSEDDVIINGDTPTHQDTGLASWTTRGYWMNGVGGSLDHRRHSIGLRARAFDVSNATDQNATQTPAGARAQRATLGLAGIEDGVYITSPEYYLAKMLGWQDFKELDSYGIANATVINGVISGPLPGQVGYIDRTPIVVSPLVTPDLAATGLYTGSGALTGMLYVNRSRFMRIVKNGRRIESATNIENGTQVTVLTERWLFDTLDSAAVKNVHWGYNLSTT